MMAGQGSKRHQSLEAAIDVVVASYGHDYDINNLESAALPNRRAVIEAYEHLKAALFLGFYSTRALSRDNLRHGLAERLYAAHELLTVQLERALHYDRWTGKRVGKLAPDDVALGLYRRLPELRRVLNTDVRAAYEGDPSAESIEDVVFSYPSLAAVTAYRVAHELYNVGVPMIPRIITEYAHSQTGIDIHPGAVIGERFFIDHGTGTVIGETAVIGQNVKVYQGVTLGALSVPHRVSKTEKRHPTIEDDVTIYSGATILGGETIIGQGSVIGGNVWLVRSVAPQSTVFGRARGTDSGSDAGP